MKSILDPTFRYIPSASTDLRKTFKRIRDEQRKARELEAAKLTRQVIPIERERKA
jgi:hypothetical protein